MPVSWVVRDCLFEIEAVLARKIRLDADAASEETKQAQLQGKDGSTISSPSAAAIQAADKARAVNPFSTVVSNLTSEEVKFQLKVLQRWLIKFVESQDLAEVFDRLMAISKQYESDNLSASADKPSTTDKKESIDDKIDNSVTYFILTTMAKLFAAAVDINDFRAKQDILVDEKAAAAPVTKEIALGNSVHTISFCFNHLQHSYSAGVRHAAAQSLGVLSHVYLQQISQCFIEKFSACKNDNQRREFASFQRAVGYIEFGVSSPMQTQITTSYLQELYKEMKKIDRGVLRQEICISLAAIFTRIMNPADAARVQQYNHFLQLNRGVEEFNEVYSNIYERVAKWSSKSKHSLFCYELLLRMLVLTRDNNFFFQKKRFDVFTATVNGFKNKEFRPNCLELMRNYIRDLPTQFIQHDVTLWNNQMKLLCNALLPRGKTNKPTPEETPILTELLSEIGRKHTNYVVQEVIAPILQPKSDYFSKQKAIALRVLGQIAREKKQEVQGYIYQLGPLLAPFIEEMKNTKDEKQIMLLRAALTCFPFVRQPKAEHVQQTASSIISLTLHEDREISLLTSQCLTEFILLDINANFLPTMHSLVDLLLASSGLNPLDILKTVNNATVLLQQGIDYIASPQNNEKPFRPSAQQWIALREHTEAVCLNKLTHPESWVRLEILRLLLKISAKPFEALENSLESGNPPPKLINFLLPNIFSEEQLPSNPEAFFTPLKSFLLKDLDQFRGIIATAFSQLYRSCVVLQQLDQGENPNDVQHEEWQPVFNNKLLFLALTARVPDYTGEISASAPQNSAEGQILPLPSPSSGSKPPLSRQDTRDRLISLPTEQVFKQFVAPRERLARVNYRAEEINYFFESTVGFLQSNNSSGPLLHSLRLIVAEDLAQINSSCYAELTRHLRKPLLEPEITKKNKNLPRPDIRKDFFYDEHTLDVICRVIVNLTAEEYNLGPTVLTRTIDELITQWAQDLKASSDYFQQYNNTVRYYLASILTRFIYFRTTPQQHPLQTPKNEVIKRRIAFFSLFSALLPSKTVQPATGNPMLGKLQSAVLSGIIAIITLNEIYDKSFGNNVLELLERYLIVQSSCSDSTEKVSLALQVFLRGNSGRVHDFISFSIEEAHLSKGKSPEIAQLIARFYLKALINGFINDFSRWSNDYAVHPAAMLMISLLHQNNPDPECRCAALTLAREIIHREEAGSVSIDSDSLRNYSHPTQLLFTQATQKFSLAAAYSPSFANYLQPLLREAVNLFKLIRESKRETVLNILTPFVAQFGPLTAAQSISPSEVQAILTHLVDITRMCQSSEILQTAAGALWVALPSILPIADNTVQIMIQYALDNYKLLLQQNKAPNVLAAGADLSAAAAAQPTRAAATAAVVAPTDSAGAASIQAAQDLSVSNPNPPNSTAAGSVEGERKEETAAPAAAATPPGTGEPSAVLSPGAELSTNAGEEGETGAVSPTKSAVGEPKETPSTPTESKEERKVVNFDTPGSPGAANNPVSVRSGGRMTVVGTGLGNQQITAATANLMKSDNPVNRLIAVPIDPTPVETLGNEPLHYGGEEEKALYRLIFTHLSRSAIGSRIIKALFRELRFYNNVAPIKPESFVEYFNSKVLSSESLNWTESAAFHLLVNTLFEKPSTEMQQYFPILLQNAFVLFSNSPESSELVINIALALHLFDSQSASTIISKENVLISTLPNFSPAIRDRWSEVALNWALNSNDRTIIEASWRIFFQLELHSFFTGVNSADSTLVRVLLSVYFAVKTQDKSHLSRVVELLTHYSEISFTQLEWSAILATAWALLTFSEIAVYELGLKLLQHCLIYSGHNQEIDSADRRKWLSSLGNFVAKSEEQELDNAVIEVTYKGLTDLSTVQSTLNTIQLLLELYSEPSKPVLAKKNKLIQLFFLTNLTLAAYEINQYYLTKSKSKDIYEKELQNKQLNKIIENLTAAALLSYSYSTREDCTEGDIQFYTNIAMIFRHVATAIEGLLPHSPYRTEEKSEISAKTGSTLDFSGDSREEKEAAVNKTNYSSVLAEEQAKLHRSAFKRMQRIVKGSAVSAESSGLDGTRLPAVIELMQLFFAEYCRLFNGAEHFDFSVSFFLNFLGRGAGQWRIVLLHALGRYFLNSTKHSPNQHQFALLSDLITQSYISHDQFESHLAENVAFILVQRRNASDSAVKSTDTFNFLKTKQLNHKANANKLGENKLLRSARAYDFDTELKDALQRLEAKAFPFYNRILSENHQVLRPSTAAGPLKQEEKPIFSSNNGRTMARGTIAVGEAVKEALHAGLHSDEPREEEKTFETNAYASNNNNNNSSNNNAGIGGESHSSSTEYLSTPELNPQSQPELPLVVELNEEEAVVENSRTPSPNNNHVNALSEAVYSPVVSPSLDQPYQYEVSESDPIHLGGSLSLGADEAENIKSPEQVIVSGENSEEEEEEEEEELVAVNANSPAEEIKSPPSTNPFD
jgi:hypothetical protein